MHTGKYVLYPDRVPKERQVKSEERNLKKKKPPGFVSFTTVHDPIAAWLQS